MEEWPRRHWHGQVIPVSTVVVGWGGGIIMELYMCNDVIILLLRCRRCDKPHKYPHWRPAHHRELRIEQPNESRLNQEPEVVGRRGAKLVNGNLIAEPLG